MPAYLEAAPAAEGTYKRHGFEYIQDTKVDCREWGLDEFILTAKHIKALIPKDISKSRLCLNRKLICRNIDQQRSLALHIILHIIEGFPFCDRDLPQAAS